MNIVSNIVELLGLRLLVLCFFYSSSCQKSSFYYTVEAVDTTSTTNLLHSSRHNNNNDKQIRRRQRESSKIISGFDAENGRYPYFTILADKDKILICGGTLIAPDMVLSAAHCLEGVEYAITNLYDVKNWNKEDGVIEVDKFFPHPIFDWDLGRYDTMIVKLKQSTELPYIKLNSDPNIPEEPQQFSIIGFGATDHGPDGSLSTTLQETFVNYVPNDECVKSQNKEEKYSDYFFDEMICGYYDDKQAQCYGDSGGPYIIKGDTYEDDLHIGSVSWGIDCSQTGLPGVGSRTSSSFDYIKAIVCKESENPPDGWCVQIITSIYFDDTNSNNPEDISWSIRDIDQTYDYVEYISMERKSYDKDQITTVTHTTYVPRGRSYKFHIENKNGNKDDNISPVYDIRMNKETEEIILVQGNTDYEAEHEDEFFIPEIEKDPISNCYKMHDQCMKHSECCSNRCSSNICRHSPDGRDSIGLREGRGGAGGYARRNNYNN